MLPGREKTVYFNENTVDTSIPERIFEKHKYGHTYIEILTDNRLAFNVPAFQLKPSTSSTKCL